MNTSWNTLSVNQQSQFLQAAGLSSLPEPSALSQVQLDLLKGIVGDETVKRLREDAAVPESGTLSQPSLPEVKNFGDWSSIMALIAQLQTEVSDLQINVATESIESQKLDVEEAHKKEAARLKESMEKLAKAAKSGLLAKIFGWIGAVVGLIGAVVAAVASGGAAAPAVALAVLGIVMMALQESGKMEEIVQFLADNPKMLIAVLGPVIGGVLCGLLEGGVIDEDKAQMAVQIAVSVTMLIASIAGMIASGGASATNMVAKVVGLIGQIAGGLASVGGGASTIAQATYSYQAENLKADSKEIQAWLAKLQAMLSEEMDFLQEVIDKMNSGLADASDLLDDIAKSHHSVISNMGS